MKWILTSFLISLLLVCGCSPSSSEEFRREGSARCQALIRDLEKIENHEQLLSAELQLKKHFESLVSLMVEAAEFQQKNLDSPDVEGATEERGVDEKLQEELRRIYTIEGGREVIERCQQEGLVRLDAYERALVKKRARLVTPRVEHR